MAAYRMYVRVRCVCVETWISHGSFVVDLALPSTSHNPLFKQKVPNARRTFQMSFGHRCWHTACNTVFTSHSKIQIDYKCFVRHRGRINKNSYRSQTCHTSSSTRTIRIYRRRERTNKRTKQNDKGLIAVMAGSITFAIAIKQIENDATQSTGNCQREEKKNSI